MNTFDGLRETTMRRLDATLSRLEDPLANFDLETRVFQHSAVYKNLQVLRGLGYWDELNTYFGLFQAYLKRRGDL